MLLDIRNLSKTYPGTGTPRPVLRDVCLTQNAGETLALTGESGSGKSTLLHLIGALDVFDGGDIIFDGVALSGLDDAERSALRRRDIGLVFQQFNLVPSLTVAQNIAIHARLADRVDPRWISEITDRLGLAELTGRYPDQLSGGQQQRVAIGRALALRPKLLLADEPTGNLDEAISDTVLDMMLELVTDVGAALFLVTHSSRIAGRLSRRAHLSGGRIT